MAIASVLVRSSPAFGHDRRVAVDLAGADCVAQDALHEAVASRGGNVDAEAMVRLRVRVTKEEEGKRVVVEVAGDDERGALAPRSLVATSCKEALDAVALLIALAADLVPPPPSMPPMPPVAEGRGAAIERAPDGTDRTDTADARPTREPRRDARPTTLYASGALTGTALGSGQVGARAAFGASVDRTLLPWAEASAGANLPRMISGGGGEANLMWLTARMVAAPLGARIGSSVRASVYAGAEGGALFASGSGPSRVASETRPWLAAIAGGRLRWEIGQLLFASLEAGGIVPLLRDEFVFLRGGTAYQVPMIALEGAISLGARFP